MATTAQAICTLAGHDLSRRHEDRDRRRRPERRPPVGKRQAFAVATSHSLDPDNKTKIPVRVFVSPMCRDLPEWTSINRDTQGRGHTPMAGRLQEEIPAQRTFGMRALAR